MAESENWQFNKSALECHKYMLQHSIHTDVAFVVSNKVNGPHTQDELGSISTEKFKAHKYQLICRSPVFYAMLCGDLAEKGDIVVDDVEPLAFKEMLNYIYADEVDLKPELVMHILYASKKYLLPSLTKLCVEYLEKDLNGDNACVLYDHSLLFDEVELSERALLMIKYQTQKCLKAPSLEYIRQSTLSKILDSRRFTAPEIEVFSACERWARYQVKQTGNEMTGEAMRMALGDCINKIRYPSMKFEDFGTCVASTGILLVDEENSIFRFFASKGKTSLPEQFNFEDRFLEGPFTVTYDGPCAEIQTGTCTTRFEITCDQSISVKELRIGEMKYGTSRNDYGSLSNGVTLTCSDLKVDNDTYQLSSFEIGNPCRLHLQKPIAFREHSKRLLEITLRLNMSQFQSIYVYPALKSANSKELTILDSKTDLHISVSTDNKMFLLGLTYDYGDI